MLSDLRARLSPRVLIISAVLLVVVVFGGWTAFNAAKAAIELDRASGTATTLQRQLASGDVKGARESAETLQQATSSARSRTGGVDWAVAERVPYFGDDLRALATVSEQLDKVSTDALPTVLKVAGDVSLKTFSPRDGKIDLAAVRKVRPAIEQSSGVLQEAEREIGAIDPDKLVGRVRAPVTQLQDRLEGTNRAAQAADVASRLLPDMLGGDGKRRYLLIIQNNAEIRTLGGIPGSIAVLEANKGKVRMTRQGSSGNVGIAGSPVVRLTRGERTVFSTDIGKDLRDSTSSPDFPRAASVADKLVARAFDTRFDGVVSVDPVVLSSLLRYIGAVEVQKIPVTADNVVDGLLHGVYVAFDKNILQQDLFFQETARAIFDRFTSGQGDAVGVVRSLVASATDRRIMVWSKRPAEERIISTTGVSGELVRGGKAPQIGVYLSDAAGGKMQYYLNKSTTVRAVRCTDSGRQVIQVVTRLESGAPSRRATIPRSVAGLSPSLRRGDQRVNVRIFAPEDGTITGLQRDARAQTVVGGTYEGRPVAVVPVRLEPGQSTTIVATVESDAKQTGGPVLTTTPGINLTPTVTRIAGACG